MAISSGTVRATGNVNFSIARANTSLADTSTANSLTSLVSFTSIGAGAGAFSEIYCAVRTLAGGASETLDLYGSLTNLLNETINFARIKVICIELLTTTLASSITVGNAASNPFVGPLGGTTPTITIRNGGVILLAEPSATGWPVSNGSTDNLKILNNDGAVTATYRITLVGSIT